MKETLEKQVTNYTTLEFPDLLSLAMSGDKAAAAEIIRRQDAQKQEIESLKAKAARRKPAAEKTALDLAKDNAYYRCALLVKQFGQDNVTLQTLTAASAFLECGLAQGNLRQALNRVSQVIKAQAVTETVFPDWIVEAAGEIPLLDENKRLEEEEDKVAEIKAIVKKYMDNDQRENSSEPENSEPVNTPAATTPAKKGAKK